MIHSERIKKAIYTCCWGVGSLLLLLIVCLPRAFAQEEAQLRLVAIDTTTFPTVRITLLTGDSRSAPVDLADLALRENGAPIPELTFNHIPHGVDITFVLDANGGFGEVDDSTGLTRREKTLDSIGRFADEYMNPDGLDTVSIVVPDEERQGGRFLIQEASTAEEVKDAIGTYDPQRLGPTQLNAMMVLALEQSQRRKEDGHYQAILLLTDGRRLDQQLSSPQLVAQANDANVPIYGAILGESADAHEIANVTRLSEPTRAFYVHMAEPASADPVFQIWQDQSNPVQVEYRSRQRQSGRNQVTLNLGSSLVSTSFDLLLAPPEVELSLDQSQIVRAGTAPDTPKAALQPAFQPVTVDVMWSDDRPRQISEVLLIVDGQSSRVSGDWQNGVQEQISLDWDISQLEEGTVELAVEITDELGYKGTSKPISVNIAFERPALPMPVPTVQTQEPLPQDSQIVWLRWELLASIALAVIVIVIFFLWRSRKKADGRALEDSDGGNSAGFEDPGSNDFVLVATLEPFTSGEGESYPLEGENIVIGSYAQNVQIALNDGSVNRLHARIRKQDQEYWLFDEGSFEGTFLNYERLGLAPQKLSDGDTVQFGKVKFRFSLRQIINQEK